MSQDERECSHFNFAICLPKDQLSENFMPCIEQTILSLAQRPRVLEKEHIKPSYPHTSYTSTWYFDVFGFIIKAPSNVHVVELN